MSADLLHCRAFSHLHFLVRLNSCLYAGFTGSGDEGCDEDIVQDQSVADLPSEADVLQVRSLATASNSPQLVAA